MAYTDQRPDESHAIEVMGVSSWRHFNLFRRRNADRARTTPPRRRPLHPTAPASDLHSRRPPTPAARSRIWLALAVRVIGLLVAVWAVWFGLQARQWVFTSTAPIRFKYDVKNALHQGDRVIWAAREMLQKRSPKADVARNADLSVKQLLKAEVRLLNQIEAKFPNGRYDIDYTPARLLIAALWSRHAWTVQPSQSPDYSDKIAEPMLRLNTAAAALAAVGAFFVVRWWWLAQAFGGGLDSTRRATGFGPRRGAIGRWWSYHRNAAWVAGLASAILLWLSPAVLIDAHGFPQWDVWVLPFAVWAIWLGSKAAGAPARSPWSGAGWMGAGLLLAVGAMFKGQILLGALPMMLLWSLFSRPRVSVVYLLAGLLTGTMACTLPWLMRAPGAWTSVATVITAAVIGIALSRLPLAPWRWTGVVVVGLASAAAAWAAGLGSVGAGASVVWMPAATGFLAFLAAATAALPARSANGTRPRPPVSRWLFASVALPAVQVLLVGLFLGGSFSWLKIGFLHPEGNYLQLSIGPAANVPQVLANTYQLGLKEPLLALPQGGLLARWFGPVITLKMLLIALYAAATLVLGAGLWRSARTGRRSALIPLTTTWVVMFAILPQMHERYLVWGAALTALTAVSSPGLFLLHLYVVAHAFTMVFNQMMLCGDRSWSPTLHKIFIPMQQGMGWSLAVVACVYIYLSARRWRYPPAASRAADPHPPR